MTISVLNNDNNLFFLDSRPDKFTRIRLETYFNCFLGFPDSDTVTDTFCTINNDDNLSSLDLRPDKFTRIRLETHLNCFRFYLGSPDPDTVMDTFYTDWTKLSVTYFSAGKRRDYLILIKSLLRTVLSNPLPTARTYKYASADFFQKIAKNKRLVRMP